MNESERLRECPYPEKVYLCSPHIDQHINGHNQKVGMFITDKPVGGKFYEYTQSQDHLLEMAAEALRMLSKRQIATWYSNPDGQISGYYAGWDDAEYRVKQTLLALQQHGYGKE